jgi:hypothetical protein
MGRAGTWLLLAVAFALAACRSGGSPAPDAPNGAAMLRAVALDIEVLGTRHPPLAGFRAATHLDPAQARIEYAFRTHAAPRTGGWTAGVPNPDADGIWFHIDVHDPASTLQLHTQPMVEPLCLGGARVSFLVLEGERAAPAAAELRRILARHGVVRCP